MTKTIRAHPFPNANHRTSLNLVIVYLEAVGIDWPPYSRRGRGISRYHDEIEPFIHESKYLLQVLRHQPMIEVAWEEGYEAVEFSDGFTAEIQGADVSASMGEIQDKHQRSSERLVGRIAAVEDEPRLAERNPIGLADWVEQGLN